MSSILIILSRIWPIIIPLVIYLIWHFYATKKLKKDISNNILIGFITTTLIVLIITIFFAFISLEGKRESYVPGRVVDGKITKSTVE